MDPELVKARSLIQQKMFQFLIQKQPHSHRISQGRIVDLVRRLDEGLLWTSTSQDEYLNLDTLESRLYLFISKRKCCSNIPQCSQLTSAPLGNMIPTPGMPQNGNTNSVFCLGDESDATSSVDSSSTHTLPAENEDHEPWNKTVEAIKVIDEMVAEGLFSIDNPLWGFTVFECQKETFLTTFLNLTANDKRLRFIQYAYSEKRGAV